MGEYVEIMCMFPIQGQFWKPGRVDWQWRAYLGSLEAICASARTGSSFDDVEQVAWHASKRARSNEGHTFGLEA